MGVVWHCLNSSPLGQNGCHFGRRHFQIHFFIDKLWILIEILQKFVPKCPFDNNTALVQIMAWCRIGDKPLSEPMLTRFTDAYKCGTRGKWVKPCQAEFILRNKNVFEFSIISLLWDGVVTWIPYSWGPGSHLNMNILFYLCKNSHYEDKTVSPSLILILKILIHEKDCLSIYT